MVGSACDAQAEARWRSTGLAEGRAVMLYSDVFHVKRVRVNKGCLREELRVGVFSTLSWDEEGENGDSLLSNAVRVSGCRFPLSGR